MMMRSLASFQAFIISAFLWNFYFLGFVKPVHRGILKIGWYWMIEKKPGEAELSKFSFHSAPWKARSWIRPGNASKRIWSQDYDDSGTQGFQTFPFRGQKFQDDFCLAFLGFFSNSGMSEGEWMVDGLGLIGDDAGPFYATWDGPLIWFVTLCTSFREFLVFITGIMKVFVGVFSLKIEINQTFWLLLTRGRGTNLAWCGYDRGGDRSLWEGGFCRYLLDRCFEGWQDSSERLRCCCFNSWNWQRGATNV